MKTFSNIFCSTSVGAGDIWIYFKFQTSEVSIKTFWTKWDRENLPKWFFIDKKLEKCQNEYYPDNLDLISLCRRTSLHVPMLPVSLVNRNL